ncbi:hypothetical protein GCM10023113_36220 [Cellulomonas oligotrophica]|uniref:Uncharacterized protein n=1 Tax=Cellulomonas oligotrophica TaxID=931536 RepID=A0ABQ4DFQ0_9CELL|nr:hypothetical protein Col01nite_33920 [Cellulomonas oligotrophica]
MKQDRTYRPSQGLSRSGHEHLGQVMDTRPGPLADTPRRPARTQGTAERVTARVTSAATRREPVARRRRVD